MQFKNFRITDDYLIEYIIKNSTKASSIVHIYINSLHVLIIFNSYDLQTLTTQSNYLGYFLQKAISLALLLAKSQPFVSVTADELVFGYDDTLVTLAHRFYPKHKRPMSKMGLLIGVSTSIKLFCVN